jgi:hypothetical protein
MECGLRITETEVRVTTSASADTSHLDDQHQEQNQSFVSSKN